MTLQSTDPKIYSILEQETQRQQQNLEMIASENFTSKPVMQAQASTITNKYAEGYPNKRYYAGCEFADKVEQLAIQRAKQLFNAEHANVQPHSGSNANLAAYFSILKPGQKILAPQLNHGGHLTHGSKVNISGKIFDITTYALNETTERFEPDDILEIAKKQQPKLILTGYSAYPRKIDFKKWQHVANEVDAILMADIAHIAGIIAAKQHPQPFPYCDIVTTTTHKTLRGPRGGMILTKQQYAKQVDKSVFPGFQGGPLMHIIAAKAVALKEAQQPSFTEYIRQTLKNAKVLASELTKLDFSLVTGGTDNHLILINLENKNTTGKQAETTLEQAGITANKNMTPNDKQSPFVTSGLRLGTPALTTRGMKEEQMKTIAHMINEAINNKDNPQKIKKLKQQVTELANQFPLYNNE